MTTFLVAVVLALAGCQSGQEPSPSPSVVAEPIQIEPTKDTTGVTVQVQVGNGRPVPVLLDTGSTGLRIFDAKGVIGSDAVESQESVYEVFGDGTKFTGNLTKAPLMVGDNRTSGEVTVQVVKDVSCQRDATDGCVEPLADYVRTSGTYGILGIGFSPEYGVGNPLLAIPGFEDQFTLQITRNRTGTVSPNAPDGDPDVSYRLSTGGGGDTGGNSVVQACWKFLGASDPPSCVETLFDSGNTAFDVNGKKPIPGTPDGSGQLQGGVGTVGLYASDSATSPEATVVSSNQQSGWIEINPGDSDDEAIVAGLPFFMTSSVTYRPTQEVIEVYTPAS